MNKIVNDAAYDMFVLGFLIQEELTKEKCEDYLRSLYSGNVPEGFWRFFNEYTKKTQS